MARAAIETYEPPTQPMAPPGRLSSCCRIARRLQLPTCSVLQNLSLLAVVFASVDACLVGWSRAGTVYTVGTRPGIIPVFALCACRSARLARYGFARVLQLARSQCHAPKCQGPKSVNRLWSRACRAFRVVLPSSSDPSGRQPIDLGVYSVVTISGEGPCPSHPPSMYYIMPEGP